MKLTLMSTYSQDLLAKILETFKKYVCKICEKEVFFGKNAHIRKYHTCKEGLKCPKCGKMFPAYKNGEFSFVKFLDG